MQYSEEGDDSYYDSYYEVSYLPMYLNAISDPVPIWFELWAVLRIRIRIGSAWFWAPGSISTRSESCSGSFYHQAKIVRKILISSVL
jgi:hypothetical protein